MLQCMKREGQIKTTADLRLFGAHIHVHTGALLPVLKAHPLYIILALVRHSHLTVQVECMGSARNASGISYSQKGTTAACLTSQMANRITLCLHAMRQSHTVLAYQLMIAVGRCSASSPCTPARLVYSAIPYAPGSAVSPATMKAPTVEALVAGTRPVSQMLSSEPPSVCKARRLCTQTPSHLRQL